MAPAASDPSGAARAVLLERLAAERDALVETTARLVRAPSGNPPGDTKAVAEAAAELLGRVEGAEIEFVTAEHPIVNLVARVTSGRPGRRLVFNGHLDTFPVGDPAGWSVDPLGAVVEDGRLYGRGVSDMKGGLACSMTAFKLLAAQRDAWDGEMVITFAGDEEVMGTRGTQHLLDTVPHAAGDAMICGDAGSPRVLRFGEKGMVWLEVAARGRAAHGAHVHLGDSAIDRLIEAVQRLNGLRNEAVAAPPAVAAAIGRAESVSEPLSGAGESRVLRRVTVNCGVFDGGGSTNLVADAAAAKLDIRLPAGFAAAEAVARIDSLLGPLDGVSYRVARQYDPTWTDPDHEIVATALANARAVVGPDAVANMRVGASDSRLYRLKGVPSVVCGLTPHNMGGPDEYVTLDELDAVCRIHALTALDFLSATRQAL